MKNEFHGRRNRWVGFKGRTLITFVLVFSMIVSAPFFSNAAGEEPDKFIPDQKCSLTVITNNAQGEFADLLDTDLVIELYQLASAQAIEGSDGYTFQWNTPYASLQSIYEDLGNGAEAITADDLHGLSQEAAGLVLDVESRTAKAGITPDASVTGKGNIEVTGLNAGLYLLVTRGSNTAGYVTTRKTGEDGLENIVTMASSSANSYTFLPQLVSLPTKSTEEGVVANTADQGPWQYGVTVYLKPELNNGSLRIVKTLDSYHVNGGPVTFVFEVEATMGGEIVYSKIFPLIFDNTGSKEILINDIPTGARVTVREIYSGWSYTVDGPSEQTIEAIGSLTTEEVRFNNTFDRRRNRGHGIINRFTYNNATQEWDWVPIEESSQE